MAVPEDAGYPLKWFKQQEFVRNLYECLICLEVVRDPVQVRDCGHQFCRHCLDGVMKSQRRCPSCRIEISNEMIFSDIAAMRVIGKLDVNCPNNGCEWDGCLNSLLQEHTEMCPFHVLDCTHAGCNKQAIRRDLEAHLAECEHRTVICEYCNIEHVFKNKAEHLEECPNLPIKCANNCPQENIARNKMEEHLKTECSETVVKCKFAEFGCNSECQRCKLEEHLNQGVKDHLELLKDKYEKDIQVMKQKHEKDIQEMKQKHENDIQDMKQKCEQYEEDMGEMKQKINTAPHLMIIRDFNKKLLEAKNSNSYDRIDSDSFYSSTYGYKMKLSVYLNETREQYKNHMGVYLCIMKSDHDAILSWPFNKKYTFTLIDQNENEEARENISMSITPKVERYFKRPLRYQNDGYGHPNFISHTKLQTRKYVKDNIVFIKLSIET